MSAAGKMSAGGRWLRSTIAVLLGLSVAVVASTATDIALHSAGIFPGAGEPMADSLWLLATGYRVVYQIAGCALAARLAPDRPMQHALTLGAIGMIIAILGVVMTWGKGPGYGPPWYSIGLAVSALPCAWIGGMLHGMTRGTRSA
jgi:hypothetical protein